MRKEAQNWLDQAADDFDGAEFNFQGKRYSIASFLCQQAVEKALKALLIEKTGNFPRIHDLTRLARLLEAPKDIVTRCSRITPAYTTSRYPDAPKQYSKEDCEKLLGDSKVVLKWIEEKLG
jgi:HEPN domain-containing protein